METTQNDKKFVDTVLIAPKLDDQFFDHYQDNGCNESPACLICPLEMCKHDDPAWYRSHIRIRRDNERAKATMQTAKEMSITEAVVLQAARFKITPRTIWRILGRTNTDFRE